MNTTRRLFIKQSGIAFATFAAAPPFLVRAALAQNQPGGDSKDRPIIVAIFQRGAADGISMVVPFGDKHYQTARPQIAVQDSIDLDGFFGLHPSLAPLKPIYDEGHLAIVHAVGSPANTRSHFDAQDYMESGTPGNKSVSDGWLNRYLQGHTVTGATPFRAVAFSSNIPRTLMGPAPSLAMTRISDFGIRGGPRRSDLEDMFAELYRDTFDAVKMLRKANPQQYTPANDIEYPNSPYGQALLQIAQLVKANVGLEVAFADIGGWDTHANQGASRGQLANRLTEFGQGLSAFYRDLGDRMNNIVVLTMTEFGRSISQNGSGGTDHGHASCLFLAGGKVKGGKVYGEWPGLAPEQLYEGRDLALTTDFRQVFSEILVKHMGAKDVSRVFPGFRSAANGANGSIGVIRG
ncbi:MAG: DUF1501 domain-containing protein, partial [Acidobacteria bacterium]|nr:DUF1501 domain-containing protein [Acidobacteriota bacterium]